MLTYYKFYTYTLKCVHKVHNSIFIEMTQLKNLAESVMYLLPVITTHSQPHSELFFKVEHKNNFTLCHDDWEGNLD